MLCKAISQTSTRGQFHKPEVNFNKPTIENIWFQFSFLSALKAGALLKNLIKTYASGICIESMDHELIPFYSESIHIACPKQDSIHRVTKAQIYWMKKLMNNHTKPPRLDPNQLSLYLLNLNFSATNILPNSQHLGSEQVVMPSASSL